MVGCIDKNYKHIYKTLQQPKHSTGFQRDNFQKEKKNQCKLFKTKIHEVSAPKNSELWGKFSKHKSHSKRKLRLKIMLKKIQVQNNIKSITF